MKTLPDRDEVLALVGVWLIWPTLHFADRAFFKGLDEFSGSLPFPVRFGLQLCLTNRWAIPSFVGMVAVVVIGRIMADRERKKTAFHAVTLCAFGFSAAILGLMFMGW